MHARRPLLVAGLGLGVSTALLASSMPASGAVVAASGSVHAGATSARVAVATVSPTAGWQRVSAGGIIPTSQPTLLRRSGTLHVAWHRSDSPLTESIRTRTIAQNGVLGPAGTAVSGWIGLNEDPVLVDTPAAPLLLYGGMRATELDEVYDGQTAGSSWTGSTWAFTERSFTRSAQSYGSSGTAAAAYAGDQVNGFSLDEVVRFHQGSDPDHVGIAGEFAIFREPLGTATSRAALVADPGTGALWAAWWDRNPGNSIFNGVRYARVLPTASWISTAPSSRTTSGSSLDPGQRVAAAGVASGAWLAYRAGYPRTTSIKLYNLRTKRAVTVPGSAGAEHVSLAASPGGRLWVVWGVAGGTAVRATRTNVTVTGFEPVQTVATPSRPRATAVDGSLGAADVLVVSPPAAGSSAYEVLYRRVMARFAVKATVRGSRVSVTVADAGLRLRGVGVRWKTKRTTTSASGTASLSVGRKKGTRTLVLTKSGYVTVKVKVRIR